MTNENLDDEDSVFGNFVCFCCKQRKLRAELVRLGPDGDGGAWACREGCFASGFTYNQAMASVVRGEPIKVPGWADF